MSRPSSLSSQLASAIAGNHVELVEELLKAGVDINRTSRDGFTPLSIATFWGCNDIVKVLLKNGADVNATNHGTKWTPLHCAVFQGQGKAVMLLMERDPNLMQADIQGISSVDLASTEEKIWGFFAAKGCSRTPKEALLAKGVIQKVEARSGSKEAAPRFGARMADCSRPGSAYVVRHQDAALARPHTAASRRGSRATSRAGSSRGSSPATDHEDDLTRGVDKLDLGSANSAGGAGGYARAHGDVLSNMPSPVAEELTPKGSEATGFDGPGPKGSSLFSVYGS